MYEKSVCYDYVRISIGNAIIVLSNLKKDRTYFIIIGAIYSFLNMVLGVYLCFAFITRAVSSLCSFIHVFL